MQVSRQPLQETKVLRLLETAAHFTTGRQTGNTVHMEEML